MKNFTFKTLFFLLFSLPVSAQVDFIHDYTTPSCPDVTVNFDYVGTYPDAAFYYWDFGDGIGSDFGVNTNISYTYTTSGTYLVALYVLDFNYEIVNFSYTELTLLGENYQIVANPNFSNAGESIFFLIEGNNLPNQVNWNFGDGNSSTELNPNHVYDQIGNYDVSATFQSVCGTTTITTQVYISDVNFTYSAPDFCANAPINFEFSGSNPNISQYFWDMGDGNTVNEQNPTYSYNLPGDYIVTLIALDIDLNILGGYSDTIHVLGEFYTIMANPSNTTANTPINFSLEGEQIPSSVVWDFGDGNSSTDISPIHQYSSSGQYFITAVVSTSCGELTYYSNVSISNVDFTYSTSTSCAPSEVSFQYTGNEPDAVNFTWEFGDENFSCCDVLNPTNTYTSGGTYSVLLTVYDLNWNIIGVMNKEIVLGNGYSLTENYTTCVPYTWNGQTYTESGDYVYSGVSQSLCDSIVTLHLTISNNIQTNQNINACGSYTWAENGNTYTNSGTYSETYTSVFGCDSIVNLNLNIGSPSSSSTNLEVCNSYTWNVNNQTYSETGVYIAVIPNIYGCDSTLTLNLTITQPYNTTEDVMACNFFTWPVNGQMYFTTGTYTENLISINGCDSIITLNLSIGYATFGNETIESCSSYLWSADNQLYIESGVYTAFLTNALGCDSLATLNLTINTIDNSVSLLATTLTSNEVDATYQWVDCSNGNSPINGETNASFTATQNGIYAVEVTKNSCTETSDCTTINSVGIDQLSASKVVFFPNPTNDIVTINGIQNSSILQIYDLSGNEILNKVTSNSETINLSKQENGIYYFQLIENGTKMIYKVVKL